MLSFYLLQVKNAGQCKNTSRGYILNYFYDNRMHYTGINCVPCGDKMSKT